MYVNGADLSGSAVPGKSVAGQAAHTPIVIIVDPFPPTFFSLWVGSGKSLLVFGDLHEGVRFRPSMKTLQIKQQTGTRSVPVPSVFDPAPVPSDRVRMLAD